MTTPDPTPSSIPQSSALTEASLLSIQEEFSRDPEHYQEQSISFIISEMRAQRARLEASAETRPVRAAKPASTNINLADLGFGKDPFNG